MPVRAGETRGDRSTACPPAFVYDCAPRIQARWKVAAVDERGSGEAIEGVLLEQVAREFGTPLYVYSRAAIEAAFAAYERAFSPVPHRLCYSVKANGNGSILRLLAGLGAGADVVSGGELLAARRAGFDPERIVFAGVGKTDAEIALGIEHGIWEFNAEGEGEIRR